MLGIYTFSRVAVATLLLIATPCVAANAIPPYVRDIYDAIAELRNISNNCEAELYTLQEKLQTQEQIADSIYKEQAQFQRQTQELVKNKSVSSEQRLSIVEKAVPLLQADIQTLKNHLEKQSSSLLGLQSKLSVCEKLLAQQEQASLHLQQAMQALTIALQQETQTAVAEEEADNAAYCVREGDSLAKIARRHNVTIRALKDANSLNSDKIRIGQILAIPKTL